MKTHEISENYVTKGGEKQKICGDDPLRHENAKFYTFFRQRTLKMIPWLAEQHPYIGNIWECPPPHFPENYPTGRHCQLCPMHFTIPLRQADDMHVTFQFYCPPASTALSNNIARSYQCLSSSLTFVKLLKACCLTHFESGAVSFSGWLLSSSTADGRIFSCLCIRMSSGRSGGTSGNDVW